MLLRSKVFILSISVVGFAQNLHAQALDWILLGCGEITGSCPSETDCVHDILCYGLEYTPSVSGVLTSYTTGFFANCSSIGDPLLTNMSCVMEDNSQHIDACSSYGLILFNSSANSGNAANNTITAGESVIIHQVCFNIPYGESALITEDFITDLTLNIDLENGTSVTDFPTFDDYVIDSDQVCLGPTATNNISTGNDAGTVVQEVIYENDGYGVDSDPNDNIDIASVCLDPTSVPGGTGNGFDTDDDGDIDQVISTEGTWTCDNNGNVSFTPAAGFTHDPSPIAYTISDLTLLLSNPAYVGVDYIPVAQNDESAQNMPTATVQVDILANDDQGDLIDPSTTNLNELSVTNGNCSLTDAQGHCIEVTIIGVGVWAIDENTGMLTFTPEAGFTDDPSNIEYSVQDQEGNLATASVQVDYTCSEAQVSMFLEGTYQGNGMMSTFLNANHLLPGQDKNLSTNLAVLLGSVHTPFGHPYNTAPWNYNNTLGLQFGDPSSPSAPAETTLYDLDVVDWVLVSVREGGINPVNKIWTCAGWLHSNGVITFPETCQCLIVDQNEDYFIMVEHRNHIGALSNNPVNKLNGNSILQWDFTIQNSYTPDIFRQGQKELENGVWGLFAANGDQLNTIQAVNSADQTIWKTHQNEINYRYGDFNLNVITNSEDETIWKSNQNISTGVIFFE